MGGFSFHYKTCYCGYMALKYFVASEYCCGICVEVFEKGLPDTFFVNHICDICVKLEDGYVLGFFANEYCCAICVDIFEKVLPDRYSLQYLIS